MVALPPGPAGEALGCCWRYPQRCAPLWIKKLRPVRTFAGARGARPRVSASSPGSAQAPYRRVRENLLMATIAFDLPPALSGRQGQRRAVSIPAPAIAGPPSADRTCAAALGVPPHRARPARRLPGRPADRRRRTMARRSPLRTRARRSAAGSAAADPAAPRGRSRSAPEARTSRFEVRFASLRARRRRSRRQRPLRHSGSPRSPVPSGPRRSSAARRRTLSACTTPPEAPAGRLAASVTAPTE